MIELKQRELRDLVARGKARRLDSTSEAKKLGRLELLGLSYGVYGMNGALCKGEGGELWAVIGRSAVLWYVA